MRPISQYNQDPDLVREIQALQGRIAQLERQQIGRFVDPVRARIEVATNDVPNSTTTVISFGAAVEDTAGAWSASLPSRLTAPRTGTYVVAAKLMLSFNAAGDRRAEIRLNASYKVAEITVPAPGGNSFMGSPAGLIPLEAGDYIELWAWQNSGGTRTVQDSALSFAWLGVS